MDVKEIISKSRDRAPSRPSVHMLRPSLAPRRLVRTAHQSSGLPFRIRAPLARLMQKEQPKPAFRQPALGDGEALLADDKGPDYLSLALRARVYDLIGESPLQHAPALSESLGDATTVHIKREDMQPTFSFYVRCAINELSETRFGAGAYLRLRAVPLESRPC